MSGAPIVSSRVMVINPGQLYVDASVRVPDCPLGESFLVTGVYAAPEILSDNNARDAAHLPRWGISVPIVQRRWDGQHSTSLFALSPGMMPAAKRTAKSGGSAAKSRAPRSRKKT